jgi:hypothetical protein
VKYYWERRDPHLEAKRREVLLVYREVVLQKRDGSGILPVVMTVSVDKPRSGGCCFG